MNKDIFILSSNTTILELFSKWIGTYDGYELWFILDDTHGKSKEYFKTGLNNIHHKFKIIWISDMTLWFRNNPKYDSTHHEILLKVFPIFHKLMFFPYIYENLGIENIIYLDDDIGFLNPSNEIFRKTEYGIVRDKWGTITNRVFKLYSQIFDYDKDDQNLMNEFNTNWCINAGVMFFRWDTTGKIDLPKYLNRLFSNADFLVLVAHLYDKKLKKSLREEGWLLEQYFYGLFYFLVINKNSEVYKFSEQEILLIKENNYKISYPSDMYHFIGDNKVEMFNYFDKTLNTFLTSKK